MTIVENGRSKSNIKTKWKNKYEKDTTDEKLNGNNGVNNKIQDLKSKNALSYENEERPTIPEKTRYLNRNFNKTGKSDLIKSSKSIKDIPLIKINEKLVIEKEKESLDKTLSQIRNSYSLKSLIKKQTKQSNFQETPLTLYFDSIMGKSSKDLSVHNNVILKKPKLKISKLIKMKELSVGLGRKSTREKSTIVDTHKSRDKI